MSTKTKMSIMSIESLASTIANFKIYNLGIISSLKQLDVVSLVGPNRFSTTAQPTSASAATTTVTKSS